jgi:hypothetical protein
MVAGLAVTVMFRYQHEGRQDSLKYVIIDRIAIWTALSRLNASKIAYLSFKIFQRRQNPFYICELGDWSANIRHDSTFLGEVTKATLWWKSSFPKKFSFYQIQMKAAEIEKHLKIRGATAREPMTRTTLLQSNAQKAISQYVEMEHCKMLKRYQEYHGHDEPKPNVFLTVPSLSELALPSNEYRSASKLMDNPHQFTIEHGHDFETELICQVPTPLKPNGVISIPHKTEIPEIVINHTISTTNLPTIAPIALSLSPVSDPSPVQRERRQKQATYPLTLPSISHLSAVSSKRDGFAFANEMILTARTPNPTSSSFLTGFTAATNQHDNLDTAEKSDGRITYSLPTQTLSRTQQELQRTTASILNEVPNFVITAGFDDSAMDTKGMHPKPKFRTESPIQNKRWNLTCESPYFKKSHLVPSTVPPLSMRYSPFPTSMQYMTEFTHLSSPHAKLAETRRPKILEIGSLI